MRFVAFALVLLLSGSCRSPSSSVDGRFEPAGADPAARRDEPLLESGAGLYMQYCASCHGATAQGNGPAAAALRQPPSDLTRLDERYGEPLPKERLASLIDGRVAVAAHGTREMPVWGEKLYAGDRPDSPARDAARAGTILLILEYLDTQQRSIAPSKGP
jgi:hypothetical protein